MLTIVVLIIAGTVVLIIAGTVVLIIAGTVVLILLAALKSITNSCCGPETGNVTQNNESNQTPPIERLDGFIVLKPHTPPKTPALPTATTTTTTLLVTSGIPITSGKHPNPSSSSSPSRKSTG